MNRPVSKISFFAANLRAIILIGMTAAFLSACGDNPGKWDAERIKAEMEKDTKMKITVAEPSDGSATATGTDRKGRTFTFKIELYPKTRAIQWTSFDENGKRLVTHYQRKPK